MNPKKVNPMADQPVDSRLPHVNKQSIYSVRLFGEMDREARKDMLTLNLHMAEWLRLVISEHLTKGLPETVGRSPPAQEGSSGNPVKKSI